MENHWSFENLQCMALSKVLTSSIFAGTAKSVHNVSLRRKELLASVAIDSPALCMSVGEQMLYVGHESGSISVIDPRTNSIVNSMESHSGGVISLWVEDQLLVTSGLTYKLEMHVPDNTLRVYDVRNMKMVMPWPIPLGASTVKICNRVIYALCPLSYQIVSVNMGSDSLVRERIPVIYPIFAVFIRLAISE